MSKSYDIERTEQGLDISEACQRITELETAMNEIRGLATWHSTKAKGEIYARASKVLGFNQEGANK